MQGRHGTQVGTLHRKDPLEEEMATHSKFLAWRIPWTEKPGGLQSMGHRVGPNSAQHSIADGFHICGSNKPWTDDVESQLRGPEDLQTPHGALEPTTTDAKG